MSIQCAFTLFLVNLKDDRSCPDGPTETIHNTNPSLPWLWACWWPSGSPKTTTQSWTRPCTCQPHTVWPCIHQSGEEGSWVEAMSNGEYSDHKCVFLLQSKSWGTLFLPYFGGFLLPIFLAASLFWTLWDYWFRWRAEKLNPSLYVFGFYRLSQTV